MPNPFESLPDFFKRTTEFWMTEARLSLSEQLDTGTRMATKEGKRNVQAKENDGNEIEQQEKHSSEEEHSDEDDGEAERLVAVDAFLLAKNCYRSLRPLLDKLESTQRAQESSSTG